MDTLDQVLDFYQGEAEYYLTTIFPPFDEINKACGVSKKDWLDVARCKSNLKNNWIDDDEYHSIWEPIKNSIFVAGDCRHKTIRQLTTAMSDGAVAASFAIKYLENNQ